MNEKCLLKFIEQLQDADKVKLLGKILCNSNLGPEYFNHKQIANMTANASTEEAVEAARMELLNVLDGNIDEDCTRHPTAFQNFHNVLIEAALEAFADCECAAREKPYVTTKLAPEIKITKITGMEYGRALETLIKHPRK